MISLDLKRILSTDERILWSGKPGQGLRLSSADIYLIPFSLMWGGFAIFWESQAISKGTPFFFMLWGIPFVAMGLYMIAGRFFWDAYVRSQQVYAVTTQRILVKRGSNLTSHSLQNLPQLNLSTSTGTIDFGAAGGDWSGRNNYGSWNPSGNTSRFVFLSNAPEVYQIILRAQQDLLRN